MGRRLKSEKQRAAAPTLEELIEVRDDIARAIEAKQAQDPLETEDYALVTLGLRLGYVIAGSIVSIAESLRVLADEAEMAVKEQDGEKSDPRFDTL